MLTYVIRRLLLMIPTLIGITVMVFAIARFAPGRPGSTQFEAGQMSAEAQKAVREWYEERYGLDLPIWSQYLRWWRGMFFARTQAMAWYDDGEELHPLYTMRRSVAPSFLELEGSWLEVADWRLDDDAVVTQRDASFVERLGEDADQWLPEIREGYLEPRHAVIAMADLRPLESSLDADDLVPVTQLTPATVRAPGFADLGADSGYPLYLNPDPADDRPVFKREGEWFALRVENATVAAANDAGLARVLGPEADELPEALDGYAIPRFTLARGSFEPIAEPTDEDALERWSREATAMAPTMIWLAHPATGALTPLLEEEDAIPFLLVRSDEGDWRRVIGASRIELPERTIFEQSDTAFDSMLDADLRQEISDATNVDGREPRHVVYRGTPVDAHRAIESRDIRRFSEPVEIFEVTFGTSLTSNTTVMAELKRRLPVTLLLSLTAFPIIYMIAIPCGMLMAVKRGRRFDGFANFVLLALWSIPTVLSGTLLVGYAAQGGAGVEWFPNNGLSSLGAEQMPFIGHFTEDGEWVRGWLTDRLWHMVLPVVCIVYGGFAYLAKQMRAAMLDNFTMDYVRTARAKGVPSKDVILRHVLRNSLLPLITIFATILPVLIAGSVFIEKIFNIEGMGLFTFRAVQNRDYDVVQSMALIFGVLNLTGLLVADICYALADPRITYK
ncbi:MAG: ABC transporter permease subunit [Phycisphaerales bacterium]